MTGIAVDIDDTICESALTITAMVLEKVPVEGISTARQLIEHYEQPGNVPEWQGEEAQFWIKTFFESPTIVAELPVVAGSVEILQRIHQQIPVVMYITSRMHPLHQVTVDWLEKYGFPKGQVVTRSWETKSPSWKLEYLTTKAPHVSALVEDNFGAWSSFHGEFNGTFVWFNRYRKTATLNGARTVANWPEAEGFFQEMAAK